MVLASAMRLRARYAMSGPDIVYGLYQVSDSAAAEATHPYAICLHAFYAMTGTDTAYALHANALGRYPILISRVRLPDLVQSSTGMTTPRYDCYAIIGVRDTLLNPRFQLCKVVVYRDWAGLFPTRFPT
eukprot:1442871-Rhodomonas_salina.2